MTALNHILLVEDDPDIRMITELTLREIGKFEITVCASGKEALEKAFDPSIQLILLDVMMPEMDGIEVCKTVTKTRKIPIIFMTAKAQKHEIEALMALGALGVIAKPFEPTTLADQIRALWKE